MAPRFRALHEDFGLNWSYVEGLRERRRRDAPAIDPAWIDFLDRLEIEELAHAALSERAQRLVDAYRSRGHLGAALNPLGRLGEALAPPAPEADLDPSSFGLDPEQMDLAVDGGQETLRATIERMRATYCGSIGVEFTHIEDAAIKRWLVDRMEPSKNRLDPARDEQARILTLLTDAEIFERFVRSNYIGAKSYSLEGAEALIPLLDVLLEDGAAHPTAPIDEALIAMAHRGRLNVLANILGKDLREIFAEFEDQAPHEFIGRGDVKYHLGYSADRVTRAGRRLHLSLAFNPSHLEWVYPVALGRVRAKQDRYGDAARTRALPIVIHGDAAFAGQGLVAETLNLAGLAGYRVGGTVHVIVNNQIGFTTAPVDGRSTPYATDACRLLRIPIFHVNGEDPEAVVWAGKIAIAFRQEFGRDVVIDLYGYRRHGHSEVDEPSFTQPLLYAAIDRRPSVRALYAQRLVEAGRLGADDPARIETDRRAVLETAQAAAKKGGHHKEPSALAGLWSRYRGGADSDVPEVPTGVPAGRLGDLLRALARVPEGFRAHPKIVSSLLDRRVAIAGGKHLVDWGAAEALAFATLVTEGVPVRLSGQDSRRGTFAHRHAALVDVETGATWVPHANLAPDQARFEAIDSPLSEAGVLGFDYGYSLDMPDGLVLWEAQFGDFANAGQVVIDQYLSSAEDKWNRLSGIVLLLPHGFEGQGPEHSSARLERFLGLCAEENIQVANLSTPAQIFHALRRQVLRPYRKPLVVMTPQCLLRHPAASSTLEELARGSYRRILPDTTVDSAGVRRVLLCSGRVYYDLAQARDERGQSDTAIVRIEQLYPLRAAEVGAALAPYGQARRFWVQEEPWNMGAWYFLHASMPDLGLECIARPPSASPATGSHASHEIEQRMLVDRALAAGA